MKKNIWLAVVVSSFASIALSGVLGTSFTYQGQLEQGGLPASGSFDMEFRLHDSLSGGAQVGGTQTETGIFVVDGYFQVQLDFGAGVFSGEELWLSVGVRSSGSGEFVPLTPRQPVTPAPYSLHSVSADTLDGYQGEDLMDRVTYDPDGDGVVDGADTAATAGDADTVDGLDGSDLVQKSGATMTGGLTLAADPESALEAATKQYVDGASGSGAGLHGIYSDYTSASTQSTTMALLHSTTISGGTCTDEILIFARGKVDGKRTDTGSWNSYSVVELAVNSSTLDTATGTGGGFGGWSATDNFTLVSLLSSSQVDLSEDVLVEINGRCQISAGVCVTSAYYTSMAILCR